MNANTVILLAVLVVTTVTADDPNNGSIKPGSVKVTRTALHVARSLDPDATETLNVRTRTGDVATLIVKKRGGKANVAIPSPVSISSGELSVLGDGSSSLSAKHALVSSPFTTYSSSSYLASKNKSETEATEAVSSVPVQSSSRFLLPEAQGVSSNIQDTVTPLRSRRRYHVSESQNSPNAQSYNSKSNLMTMKSAEALVPAPVYIRSSPMYVKGEQQEFKKSRGLMRIDTDGVPVITGIRMPDDESDRQVWRNARVINGMLVPREKATTEEQKVINQPEIIRRPQQGYPKQPIYQEVPTIKKYSYQPYGDTRDRILQYINTINRKESTRNGGSTDSNRARMIQFPQRRSDEPGSMATSEFQARVLHYSNPDVYPTSLSVQPSRVSFEEGVRTPVLQYAHPELGAQPAKVARKHDAPDVGNDESDKIQDLKDIINVKESTLAYFAQDIHSDRSPYAYEPVMDTDEVQSEEMPDDRSFYNKRSHTSDEELPNSWNNNKAMSYMKEDVQESYGLGNDKYIKRYPYSDHKSGYSSYDKDHYNQYTYPPRNPHGQNYFSVEKIGSYQPFWERLGETIRDHVQISMEKVQDLTRPVVEPLVEATQKISKNLGFSGDQQGQTMLQEKIGGAVSAYPVLLPALGLVAGGAALGLGAVAVGRFLDVDMMKKRSDEIRDDTSELSMEHKRAIEELLRNLNERKRLEQEDDDKDSEHKALSDEQTKPEKRSLDDRLIFVVESEPNVKTLEEKHKKELSDQSSEKNVASRKSRSVSKERVPTEHKHKVFKKMMDAQDGNVFIREKRSSGEENHLVHREMESLRHADIWATTPCAKRLFCDVVTRQGEDSVLLMEKKMASLMAVAQHNDDISYHLSDVMDAVRRHDCSAFICAGASPESTNSLSKKRQHEPTVLVPL